MSDRTVGTRAGRAASIALLACAVGLSSGASEPRSSSSSDEERLLELHRAGLRAHLESDVESLLALETDDFLLVNRGELSTPPKEQRRAFLGPYLAATRFELYRDRVAPVVKVSRDGSLGWVAAQVEARGTREFAPGESRPVEFVVAWIELYERRDGEWVAIGNASSFAPGD
jgi:hypothetical protein